MLRRGTFTTSHRRAHRLGHHRHCCPGTSRMRALRAFRGLPPLRKLPPSLRAGVPVNSQTSVTRFPNLINGCAWPCVSLMKRTRSGAPSPPTMRWRPACHSRCRSTGRTLLRLGAVVSNTWPPSSQSTSSLLPGRRSVAATWLCAAPTSRPASHTSVGLACRSCRPRACTRRS